MLEERLRPICGSLIEVKSYMDSIAEPVVNIPVFAHGPYFRSTSTAHGTEQ